MYEKDCGRNKIEVLQTMAKPGLMARKVMCACVRMHVRVRVRD